MSPLNLQKNKEYPLRTTWQLCIYDHIDLFFPPNCMRPLQAYIMLCTCRASVLGIRGEGGALVVVCVRTWVP